MRACILEVMMMGQFSIVGVGQYSTGVDIEIKGMRVMARRPSVPKSVRDCQHRQPSRRACLLEKIRAANDPYMIEALERPALTVR